MLRIQRDRYLTHRLARLAHDHTRQPTSKEQVDERHHLVRRLFLTTALLADGSVRLATLRQQPINSRRSRLCLVDDADVGKTDVGWGRGDRWGEREFGRSVGCGEVRVGRGWPREGRGGRFSGVAVFGRVKSFDDLKSRPSRSARSATTGNGSRQGRRGESAHVDFFHSDAV
jgi:hypothetical protein